MKACTKCGEEKPLEDFHRRKAAKDGREANCKACRQGYYQANKERMNANSTRWRKENPEAVRRHRQKAWRTGGREYHQAWRDKNRDKWREYSRRNDKPDKQAARRARFRLNNPRYNTEYRQKRDAVIEEFTEADIALRDSGRCGVCGTDLYEPIELDHIIPISRGGHHTFDNCQLAHRSCNRQKNNQLPEERQGITPLM